MEETKELAMELHNTNLAITELARDISGIKVSVAKMEVRQGDMGEIKDNMKGIVTRLESVEMKVGRLSAERGLVLAFFALVLTGLGAGVGKLWDWAAGHTTFH